MRINLSSGAIGVKANLRTAVDYAARFGFEAIDPDAAELARMSASQLDDLRGLMRSKNIVWAAGGLPPNLHDPSSVWDEAIRAVPGVARTLQRAGVTRATKWIAPGSNSLTYLENFKLHTARTREVCTIFADHGIRFGLEYIGPKTLWARSRFPFIHTMAEAKEFFAAVDKPNLGFVLDSWHWYTAGEKEPDLLSLSNQSIVSVDLNDAPAGVPVDEQIDSRRELPLATGVIDIATFLNALARLDYDGPIRAEPFNAALRAMAPEEALSATIGSMRKAFALIRP